MSRRIRRNHQPAFKAKVALARMVKKRPGRPEDSHLQSPTDPDVSLSTHTARASHAIETLLIQRDVERNSLLPATWLASPSLS